MEFLISTLDLVSGLGSPSRENWVGAEHGATGGEGESCSWANKVPIVLRAALGLQPGSGAFHRMCVTSTACLAALFTQVPSLPRGTGPLQTYITTCYERWILASAG